MTRHNLLDLAESDSDDSLSLGARAPRTTDKMPAVKKSARGRAAANRVTKAEPKTATRRADTKKAKAAEEGIERQALADRPTNQQKKGVRGRRAKQAAEEPDQAEDVLATPPGSDEPVRTKAGRGRPRKEAVIPESVQKNDQPAAKRGRKAAQVEEAAPQQESPAEVPETQFEDVMDVDPEEQDQVEDLPTFSRFSAPPSARRANSYHAPLSASKRASSTSSLESDPSVRRRLGEMTKKYEALELKYRDLKNVAVMEAERTFDRLKKTTEEKTQTANKLISSLKIDLEAQRRLAKEGQKAQQQLEASEAKIDSLQAQIAEITSSWAESKTEIKALTTKLNAARAAEATATAHAQAAGVRVPGSAIKPGAMAARGLDGAQIQATQTAKMKENLYSDLTGLVVTGIKRDGPEDVYDCIQTGRNGTLHFKLAIPNETSDENLEEAEFMYKPQLDERRDSELIDMLPDYLVEEITFPRPHAAKFYSRVLKSLTEKLD